MNKIIIFGSGLPNVLGLIRSCGEAGYRIDIISDEKDPACGSKYVDKILNFGCTADTIDLLIKEYYEESVKPIIICGSDVAMSLLDRNYDRLKDRFFLFNANGEQGRITRFMDKLETFPIAEKVGLKTIPTWHIDCDGVIPREIDYPCLIKGNNSLYSEKDDMTICTDAAKLRSSIRSGIDYIVQKFIDKEYELDIVGLSYCHGDIVELPAVVRKIRDGLYRQSDYIKIENVSEYRELNLKAIKDLIREIGYEGIFSVELMYSKGTFYFLEVNLRNDGVGYLYSAAGVNFPQRWIHYCATGEIDELKKDKLNCPLTLMSFFDIYNLFAAKVSIVKWMKEWITSDAHFVLNVHDMRPFWLSTLGHVKSIFHRTFDRVIPKRYLYFSSKPIATTHDGCEFAELNDWTSFCRFAKSRLFPMSRWQHERFLNDKTVSFVALADDEHVYSYGWVTRGDRSYVGAHDISGLPILFDFETPPAYRGRGYYTKLLTALREKMGGIIYARPDNLPSVAAIKKAGFVQYA